MKVKEIRCKELRNNSRCNNLLLKYEGDLKDAKISTYCRKCKKNKIITDKDK